MQTNHLEKQTGINNRFAATAHCFLELITAQTELRLIQNSQQQLTEHNQKLKEKVTKFKSTGPPVNTSDNSGLKAEIEVSQLHLPNLTDFRPSPLNLERQRTKSSK